MNTEARQVSECLPAELTARIEVIKAREARTSAALSGSGAGEDRANPVGEESKTTGKVIQMPLRKRRATPQAGRPACQVLRFRNGIEGERHASTTSSVVLSR